MYIMTIGKKPVGECVFTENEDGTATVLAHYYNGKKRELIKLVPKTEEPAEGSPIKRLDNLDYFKNWGLQYMEFFCEEFCKRTGVEYKTLDEFIEERMPPKEEEPEEEPPEEEETEGEEEEEVIPFMVANIETYIPNRGEVEES